VPYSDSAPTRVATESFPVQEVHGQIFMYHRSGGGQRADEETPYPVPRIREVDEGSFVHRGHQNAGRVRMHMIELLENAADPAHFEFVHNRLAVPFTNVVVPGVRIDYTADLDFEHDQEPWQIPVQVGAVVKVLGRHIERTRGKTRVTYTGAGSILSLRIALPDVGEIEIVQTQLPVAPLEQQVHFRWFADRKVPRILVWYAVGIWVSQWRNDVRIWEGKSFRTPPMLCRHDGEVMRLRNWYKQFFPGWEPSRRALAARDEGLDQQPHRRAAQDPG
jgi:cholesterol 7-dehydrogenase